MENEGKRKFDSVYSQKVKAGKRRTYFFDVRQTKGNDYYITLTESTKKFNRDGYERHKLFLYKEDFNRFLGSLEDVINHVKTELMPDFDYEQFDRRQEEWEAQQQMEQDYENSEEASESQEEIEEDTIDVSEESSETSDDDDIETPDSDDIDEEMSW